MEARTPLNVLFASASGNAESIAKRIYEICQSKKYTAEFMDLNNFKDKELPKRKAGSALNMIIVCSTTGNGDVPENGDKFFRFIKRASQPKDLFDGVRYGVLGLGDTNYDKFCNASKLIDRRLSELGGQRFCTHGAADDATGLEEVVEPWIDQLKSHLDELYPTTAAPVTRKHSSHQDDVANFAPAGCYVKVTLTDGESHEGHKLPKTNNQGPFDIKNPFNAKVITARYLTQSGSEKQVLHMELDISGSGIDYSPGDAIGIIPQNDEDSVKTLLQTLKVYEQKDQLIKCECIDDQKEELFPRHLQQDEPITLFDLFLNVLDIEGTLSPNTLRMLAECCTEKNDRHDLTVLSLPHVNAGAYRVKISQQHASLCDILKLYPSCQPSLQQVLQWLQPIKPRYYSISCSPLRHPNSIHIAFTIVEWETPPPQRSKKYGV
ncbi:NADPH-Cytochrome P450 reductase, partial [Acrasis kona]